jgi:endonuclease YncB( thermonuclease family)
MACRLKAVDAATLIVIATMALPVTAAVAGNITGVPTVIDGDTIDIHGQRIRLHGIDAPESKQICISGGEKYRCGQRAALALSDRIGRGSVTCEAKDTDRYGRVVAVCFKGQEDLNGWLVSEGLAVAYRRYSQDYVGYEAQAKSMSVGLWAGEFVMPWDWRRGKRLASEQVSAIPGDCVIKGNISSKGARIYHVPGGRWYDRTKNDEAKGERFFCSEEEATAAGWRRSSQ